MDAWWYMIGHCCLYHCNSFHCFVLFLCAIQATLHPLLPLLIQSCTSTPGTFSSSTTTMRWSGFGTGAANSNNANGVSGGTSPVLQFFPHPLCHLVEASAAATTANKATAMTTGGATGWSGFGHPFILEWPPRASWGTQREQWRVKGRDHGEVQFN